MIILTQFKPICKINKFFNFFPTRNLLILCNFKNYLI
jgi:hypothetical protein